MEFIIGCNYWASHAGTDMWRTWEEETVRKDLEILAGHGVKYLRVFPNWRDFQPVIPVFGGMGKLEEYMLEGEKKPSNPFWLEECMLERFDLFCTICEQLGIRLIVGLLTGWMSGRLFVPPALYGKDLFRDSTALLFEQRFVRGMVTRFRTRQAVFAWDLGNECNCMGMVQDEDTASVWTGMIADAIRASDSSRPVISGMHSLETEEGKGVWTLRGQAQACDVLTTHPYPFWVKHVYKEQTKGFRTLVHASAQTRYYSDIGRKPCLVEELGTMGPMICDEETAAGFLKVNLFSNWANGAQGVMWWCASDQAHLTAVPYTRQMAELELGLMRKGGEPKPVLKTLQNFADFLRKFPKQLTEAVCDVVCIMTKDQDQEGTAYMTWALARQADLNLRFVRWDDPIPEASCYLIPSAAGHQLMPRENYLELKERVKKGAVLCVTSAGGIWSEFEEFFGAKVIDSVNDVQIGRILFEGQEYPFVRNRGFLLKPTTAQIEGCGREGNPEIISRVLGKGTVWFLNFPMESMLLDQTGGLEQGHYRILQKIFKQRLETHALRTGNPNVGVTFHPEGKEEGICVAVNYSGEWQKPEIKCGEKYEITTVWHGSPDRMEPYGAAVFSYHMESVEEKRSRQ